ncbi:hypothetical protein DRN85_09890 [Methanosarcinales archaeon]|nr:MAG: hypothetical protein DRN85_09890 [Methanosarcinales archaeon]
MNRITFFAILYCIASFLDSVISIYMVGVLGFVEKNPSMAPILGTPIHLLKEILAFLFLLFLVFFTKQILNMIGQESEKVWVVLFLPALLRWGAVAHNTILLLTGWESPLSLMYEIISSA